MLKTLDIEVVLNGHSTISNSSLTTVIGKYLEEQKLPAGSVIDNFNTKEDSLSSFSSLVKAVIIGNVSDIDGKKNIQQLIHEGYKLNWLMYTLNSDGFSTQTESDEEGGEIVLATHLTLPSRELFTLWENLYYDHSVKDNLLKYAITMMEFSRKGINPNIISCNRVILLHGPPGTGKTSLCKALAQKLSIKMKSAYVSAVLIEINSHSLFSKWFSESGKLVTNMFTKIKEICRNERLLVCVLMDEIESLVHARDQCISGNEPSDAVRVVNSMLTQIDQIKVFPNVLILATSNMTEAIDLAFVDRADIKQYLGLPSVPAIYQIYQSCLVELVKAGIICCGPVKMEDGWMELHALQQIDMNREKLLKICENSVGLSGRSLRKIPFLASALFLNSTNKGITMENFLFAMECAVNKEHENRISFQVKKERS